MSVLSNVAENLVRKGANLEITPESRYLANQVSDILRIAKGSGSHVTIHAAHYISIQLDEFASIGGSNVTIVV